MKTRISISLLLVIPAVLLTVVGTPDSLRAQNLVVDPSFEQVKNRDRSGQVFEHWEGKKFDGDCRFEVGSLAHSGNTSALLSCTSAGKIRIAQSRDLEPGRYRITAYLRGLDIGAGAFNQDTEFMFAGKYMPLAKAGSFGWTRLTYVAELATKTDAGPSFGLWAPGYLWIDDVAMERVGADAKLTAAPVLEREEAPLAPPGPLAAGEIHCPRCGYRNMPGWGKCYACGAALARDAARQSGPAVKPIASFAQSNPFEGGTVVAAHAAGGGKALRIGGGYAMMRAAQNWEGYDFLKADTFVEGTRPVQFTVEIHDTETTNYWTRVNYTTVAPPGAGTLILPLRHLPVGEKTRPGRDLIAGGITRLVFAVAEAGPLLLDNIRLEREAPPSGVVFDGLYAFDFGPGPSPVMDGFTPVTQGTTYSPGRGYGLKDAKIWGAIDEGQPDPLYRDYLAIESGGFAVDVPNGRYRVFLNIDSPPGFWGDFHYFRERSVLAQSKTVVSERMDFKALLKKYFYFWDTEDLPRENTFDKYMPVHFAEKTFDVDVKNGQLRLEFQGTGTACSVSAVVVFPVAKAAEGARFLEYVKEKRRFYFDNAFKRVLHTPEGGPLQPTAEDDSSGYTVFQRDFMKDVYYNDTPLGGETGGPLTADGFAGQIVPVTMSVVPLKDLGTGTLTVGALTGPQGAIPASAIDVGYVSYRVTRMTPEGAVYTIAPRLIVPKNSVALPKGVTRRFWLTVHIPAGTAPGTYKGQAGLVTQQGAARAVPIEIAVRKGSLNAVNIPVGPWGGPVGVPWYGEDRETILYAADMTEKSLRMLRAYGFTMFTGVPYVVYKGFKDGKPVLDFPAADRQMADVRKYGFLAVNTYHAGVIGINAYSRDLGKMKDAGFTDYSAFIKAIYTAIDRHARDKEWVPVYWNLGDEPSGEALTEAIENAKAYRQAFPNGPPYFTAATSIGGNESADAAFELAKTLHVATLAGHDETGLRKLAAAGGAWAYYNGANRWTFGIYLYKAATEFGLKFRLGWAWDAAAGDPYYALDCREDDFAWANLSPTGQLVPSVEFMRIAAGLDDYRHLLTLERLAKAKAGTPAARQAEALIRDRMAAFHLGQAEPDANFGADGWAGYRRRLADAIEALQ